MSVLRDPAFPGPTDLGAFWRSVETYADDDYTVRFILTQPLASFPEYAGIGLLPAHLLDGIDPAALAEHPYNLAPVGTGRLRWVSLEEQGGGTIVTLEQYSRFYDAARRARIPTFELYFYRDARAAFNALGRDVYALGNLTPAQLDAALASASLDVYTAYLPAYAAIIFNQQAPDRLPFFQDERVRLGLTAALNRQGLIDAYLPRQAVLADTPILPGSWAYNPDAHSAAYDPVAAGLLFNEAGWSIAEGGTRAMEGQRLAFTLLVSDHPVEREIGQAVVDEWRAVGVDASLQVIDATDLRERLAGRSFDAALVEFGQGGLADPDPYPFWHQAQIAEGQNYSGFDDRDISEALELARKDPNGVRRAELYRAFQTWFDEKAAAILLYYPAYHYTVSCQVRGIQVALLRDSSDRFLSLHEWRFATPAELEDACGG
jgi:peptide/nickel transport system substrate-binding protein